MRNKYNSNESSLFSLDYKIPYERSSIQQHLEESQEEINFIKIKLTEAYQKLENQIKNSSELEDKSQYLQKRTKQLQEKYHYEKKENIKLKQTLEVILKNRKIMQQEMEEYKQSNNKRVNEKDRIIEELQRQIKAMNTRNASLASELEDKSRLVREYSDRLKDQSMFKEQDNQRQNILLNKIQVLEQQLVRITQEKYIQVNRLRHQLKLYQRNIPTHSKQFKIEDKQEQYEEIKIERKRDFSRAPKRPIQKFDTIVSQSSQTDFNKQNIHSLQLNMPNNSLAQSSISKWKRPQSVKEPQQQAGMSSPIIAVTEDQQLTQYQIARKKAEQQLCVIEKIKRPTNEDRQKISRLEREIYHLDSDIAGLKRKIRRKY